MKTSYRFALLVLPLGLSATVFAQSAPTGKGGPRHHGGPGRGHPIVRVLDADKNHEVSASEIANAATAIRTLDTNADGKVSATELRPARPADAPERPAPPASAPEHARPVDPVMLALDANSDGEMSAGEIANASTSLAALDANKDGKLVIDEVRPLPPEGAPASGSGRGPRPTR